MDSFSWNCPYCNQNATITDSNLSVGAHITTKANKLGPLCLKTHIIACPNGKCKEFTITASLQQADFVSGSGYQAIGPILDHWQLKPKSQAKVFPDYIPAPIRQDYQEACLIRDLSPKASATLSRRCLQGIIRDFYGVSKNRLKDEIEAIREKMDPLIWAAFDAVRQIGNIGAHMEKDIDLIIDVEPKEAGLLIGLIEMLLKDLYVTRHERQQQLKAITDAAQKKDDIKNGK